MSSENMTKAKSEARSRRKEARNVIYHPTYFDPYHEVGPEELDEIPEILAELSFEHEEVLVFYANGLTVQEIAHMIGVKEDVVKSRLQYARSRAHRLIEKKRKEENLEAVK